MIESSRSVSTRRLGTIGVESEFEAGTAVTRAREAVERALARGDAATTQDAGGGEAMDTTRSPIRAPNNADTGPIVSFPPQPKPPRREATLQPLQEWEGYVVGIEGDEFVARLVDLTAGRSHESEEAVIPMAEISEYDASRMVVGSIFRWVIGYRHSVEETRTRVSQIVFRDLPRLTKDDFLEGQDWARTIASALNP